jgi:hypothetical protein
VVATLGVQGKAALITAGSQEWEDDDAHLRAALGPGTVNLRLYDRAERVWREDPELADGHRELQQRVRELRRAYNTRLARAMEAWIDLEGMPGHADVMDVERGDALETVRSLDRHHAERLVALRRAFYERYDPLQRPAVIREREQIRSELADASVVVVDGGHVPVLLNRLRLFGAGDFLAGRTVVACSGGAMALAPHVVLFHDSPPWGPGHAELGELGLGLFPGVVPLPRASERLRLQDPDRVSRMARRFAPDVCVLLDPGGRAVWEGRWHGGEIRILTREGVPRAWGDAA